MCPLLNPSRNITNSDQLNAALLILRSYSRIPGVPDYQSSFSVSGSGAATDDAPSQAINLDTGVGVGANKATFGSYGIDFVSPQRSFFSCNLVNINLGTGGASRAIVAGAIDSTTLATLANGAFFQITDAGAVCITRNASTDTSTATTINSGDTLSIEISTSTVTFFINGEIVATHTTNLPDYANTYLFRVCAYSTTPTSNTIVQTQYFVFDIYWR